MKIYILLGHINYEGDSVLGVYDSEEKAKLASDELIKNIRIGFDSYDIITRELNAPAEDEY